MCSTIDIVKYWLIIVVFPVTMFQLITLGIKKEVVSMSRTKFGSEYWMHMHY